jgi:hypothetical protein
MLGLVDGVVWKGLIGDLSRTRFNPQDFVISRLYPVVDGCGPDLAMGRWAGGGVTGVSAKTGGAEWAMAPECNDNIIIKTVVSKFVAFIFCT